MKKASQSKRTSEFWEYDVSECVDYVLMESEDYDDRERFVTEVANRLLAWIEE